MRICSVDELKELEMLCYISEVHDSYCKIKSIDDEDFECIVSKYDILSKLSNANIRIMTTKDVSNKELYLRGVLIDYDFVELVALNPANFSSSSPKGLRRALGEYLPNSVDAFTNAYRNGSRERDKSDFSDYPSAIIVGNKDCCRQSFDAYLGEGSFVDNRDQANLRHGKYNSDYCNLSHKYDLNNNSVSFFEDLVINATDSERALALSKWGILDKLKNTFDNLLTQIKG